MVLLFFSQISLHSDRYCVLAEALLKGTFYPVPQDF